MDRRSFVRNAATGVAGATLGGMAATARVRNDIRTGATLERRDFGGIGTGRAQVVWSVDTTEKVVAITCDDGPHPRLTPQILDVLWERGAQATFFLIGEAAERHPELVARIQAEGHEIGNHSNTHASVSHLNGEDVGNEVKAGAAAIERVTGEAQRWFRAPRGMLNGSLLRAAADLDQDVAMWSCRVAVAEPDTPSEEMAAQMFGDLHPGAIYLLHDGTSGRDDDERLEARRLREVPALARFLDGLDERGYRCVTLGEMVDQVAQLET